MTTVDTRWYLAEEASQQAEQTYYRLSGRADMEFELGKQVSRERLRTVTTRIRDNGAPYGAHSLVTRSRDGGEGGAGGNELLLVRHSGVGMWVLPGGETCEDESFREGAERELREEAGLEASYDGLGMLGWVRFRSGEHTAWGVLPVFRAVPEGGTVTAEDPGGEVTDAGWFPVEDLPPDTRDRERLLEWHGCRE